VSDSSVDEYESPRPNVFARRHKKLENDGEGGNSAGVGYQMRSMD
jgi:hypothetical protein